jgi:hypothetical protein
MTEKNGTAGEADKPVSVENWVEVEIGYPNTLCVSLGIVQKVWKELTDK